MNTDVAISSYNKVGLPDAFATILLGFAFILLIAPYFSNADFGIIKVPDFQPQTKAKLIVLGPLIMLAVCLLFLPVWRNPNVVKPPVTNSPASVDPSPVLHTFAQDDFAFPPSMGRTPGDSLDAGLVSFMVGKDKKWRSKSLYNPIHLDKAGFYIGTDLSVSPSTGSDIAAIPIRLEAGTYTVSAKVLPLTSQADANAYLSVGFYKVDLDHGEYPRDGMYLWSPHVTVMQLLFSVDGTWRLVGDSKSTNNNAPDSLKSLREGTLGKIPTEPVLISLSWEIGNNVVSAEIDGARVFENLNLTRDRILPNEVRFVGFGGDAGLASTSRVKDFLVTRMR
jgi:hypothetical protein